LFNDLATGGIGNGPTGSRYATLRSVNRQAPRVPCMPSTHYHCNPTCQPPTKPTDATSRGSLQILCSCNIVLASRLFQGQVLESAQQSSANQHDNNQPTNRLHICPNAIPDPRTSFPILHISRVEGNTPRRSIFSHVPCSQGPTTTPNPDHVQSSTTNPRLSKRPGSIKFMRRRRHS